MRRPIFVAAVTAAILFSGTQAFAAPFPPKVVVADPVPAVETGGYGWQPVASFSSFVNAAGVIIEATCPDNHPRAVSGEYSLSINGSLTAFQPVMVTFSGSENLSTPANSAKWKWIFYFPSGAVANTAVQYSVYCADKNEPALPSP